MILSDKALKHFHKTFIKYIAILLAILYTFSLSVSLVAGVSHELHHLLSQTLDQHHHHGESHVGQIHHDKIHHHSDLIDTLLDDASSQKDKKKDRTLPYSQRLFDHTGIEFSGIRLNYSQSQNYVNFLVFSLHSQFYVLPDIPPPKV